MLKRIKTGAEPGLSKTSAGSKLGSGLTLKNAMTWLQHFLLVSISSLNSIDSIDAIAFVWKKASQVKSLVLSTERMTSAQILPQLNRSINKLIIVFSTCDWTNHFGHVWWWWDNWSHQNHWPPRGFCSSLQMLLRVSVESVLLSTDYLVEATVALAQLALHCHPRANEIGSNAHRRSHRTPQQFGLQAQSSELTPAGSAQWFMSCVNIWNSKDSNIHLTQLR